MNSATIKILAEYIANLHRNDQSLERPEDYAQDETDTNGVAQDHVEIRPRAD